MCVTVSFFSLFFAFLVCSLLLEGQTYDDLDNGYTDFGFSKRTNFEVTKNRISLGTNSFFFFFFLKKESFSSFDALCSFFFLALFFYLANIRAAGGCFRATGKG